MAISWICPFCGKPSNDDPREVTLDIGRADSERSSQFFNAHFACLREALAPDYRSMLQDPFE